MAEVDVVVIGAGHQGLAAAVELAERGLSVCVCEAADEVGGAVRSSELTVPGIVHDHYAMNMNLFLQSAFHRRYAAELAGRGVGFARSSVPYASAFGEGRHIVVSTDRERTMRMWAEHDEGDRRGWLELLRLFERLAPLQAELASRPLGPGVAVRLLRRLRPWGRHEVGELLQVALSSTRAFGERYFASPEARAAVAAWGLHVDYGPDVSGGALFPVLEMAGGAREGLSIVRGGAGLLTGAIADMVESRGGVVRRRWPVSEILVERGRAAGVRGPSGTVHARRAVVSTSPLPLTVRLLRGTSLPAHVRQAAARYRFGPGTFMLHLAVSAPIPWSDRRLAESAYVHVGGTVDDMAGTYQQALAGRLPERPLLVVGQPAVVDPTRRSGGVSPIWIQVRALPAGWDGEPQHVIAPLLDRLECLAPGFRDTIVAQTHETPRGLEECNANLVGGDSVSGSHHVDQFLGMRPALGLSRYRTSLPGLYLAGAGTWPGAGVNAASGVLVVDAVVKDRRGRNA